MRIPPYLPFLSGPPEFVVGLKPIALGAWLNPDTESHVLSEKKSLHAEQPGTVFAMTEAGRAPAGEAAALVSQALDPAQVSVDIAEAGLRVSDDLCVIAHHDGAWRLAAALLCAPTFWSLAENIGQPLAILHGPVPDRLGPEGVQGLASRIGRVFDALAPDVVLERFNWTVQAGPERFTPSSAPLIARARALREGDLAGALHVRVERQTIRKLPQTGGVLFTIRISIDPLVAVFAVDGAKAAFAEAWARAPAHVRAYKKWESLEGPVAALLAQAPAGRDPN